MRFPIAFLVVAAVATTGAASCTTFNSARPLKPGEHAVAVTAGGPLTTIPGVGVIPLPNVTVEGRHGLVDHLDVNYGLHLLPTVFGNVGGHFGGTLQLYDAPHPFVPVVAIGQRFFFFTNIFDGRKVDKAAYALSQTDVTASWEVWGSLLYTGVGFYVPVDVEDRSLFLAPFAGVEIHPGLDWLRVQVETRWLSPVTDQRFAVVDYAAPSDRGAIAINAGVLIEFTDLFAAMVNGGHDPPAAALDVDDTTASNIDFSTRVQP